MVNFINRQFAARCLIFLIIIVVRGASSAATEITTPMDQASQTTDKPGPLGLVVMGASSGIKADYFEQTVTEAISTSGLFSGIDNSKRAGSIIRMIGAQGVFPGIEVSNDTPYVLKVRIIKVKAPSFSIHMTVNMNVVWTLYRTADKATLMHEIIASTYTGGAFEGGVIGANRVRAGAEGAARENIRIGMTMLRSLRIVQDPEIIQPPSPPETKRVDSQRV